MADKKLTEALDEYERIRKAQEAMPLEVDADLAGRQASQSRGLPTPEGDAIRSSLAEMEAMPPELQWPIRGRVGGRVEGGSGIFVVPVTIDPFPVSPEPGTEVEVWPVGAMERREPDALETALLAEIEETTARVIKRSEAMRLLDGVKTEGLLRDGRQEERDRLRKLLRSGDIPTLQGSDEDAYRGGIVAGIAFVLGILRAREDLDR